MNSVRRSLAAALTIAALVAPWPVMAEPPVGETRYLCCNMRLGNDWLSDINYDEEGMTVVPYGTPVKVLEVSRNRVRIEINGKPYKFGNDYSRKLGMPVFIERYLLVADPRPAQQGLPETMRRAIESFSVVPGMTREQVLLAVAYPIADETPDLKAGVWKYWSSSSVQHDVKFDDQGLVKEVVVTDENSHDSDEKCPVNVYRSSVRWGDDRTHVFVQVGDKLYGRLPVGDTVCLKPAPGKHVVEIRSELFFNPGPVIARMEIEVKPGAEAQFLRFQRTTAGMMVVPTAGAVFQHDNRLTVADEAAWRKRR